MKKAYSEYPFPPLVRASIKCRTQAELDDFMNYFFETVKNPAFKSEVQRDLVKQLVVILGTILRGRGRHLFCSRTLYEWLVSHSTDVELNDTEWCKRLLHSESPNSFTPMQVHISGGNSPSFVFVLTTNNKIVVWPAIRSFDATEITTKEECQRFLNGLALYDKCFTGIIVDGVPDDLKHAPRYNPKTARHLVEHPDIKGDGGTVSPHFRTGHFRLLSSERFKNKRGQVVFVSECFVKGHAQTVDSEPAEKLEQAMR